MTVVAHRWTHVTMAPPGRRCGDAAAAQWSVPFTATLTRDLGSGEIETGHGGAFGAEAVAYRATDTVGGPGDDDPAPPKRGR